MVYYAVKGNKAKHGSSLAEFDIRTSKTRSTGGLLKRREKRTKTAVPSVVTYDDTSVQLKN